MKKYLYDYKNIHRCCAFCEYAALDEDGETVVCRGKRTRDAGDCCRRFRYDPLKRTPKRTPKLPEFEPDEFKL